MHFSRNLFLVKLTCPALTSKPPIDSKTALPFSYYRRNLLFPHISIPDAALNYRLLNCWIVEYYVISVETVQLVRAADSKPDGFGFEFDLDRIAAGIFPGQLFLYYAN